MYIGNPSVQSFATVTSQSFNGDGSTTVFTLNKHVNSATELECFVSNVQQEPGTGKAFTASGTTLTFSEAPPSGTGNIYVIYRGLAQHVGQDENAPRLIGDNTLTGNQTITGDLTVDTSTLKVDSSNNRVGIGTASPSAQLHIDEASSNSYATIRLEGNNRGGDIEMYQGTVPVSTIRGDQSGNLYFKTSGAYGSSSLTTKLTLGTTGDISIQKNTSGFGNITSFGTVTLADDASIQFASGTHCGGANHIYVYETGTGSNAVYYAGFNKAAVLNGNYLETGGIGFASSDSDGNVSLFSGGSHAFYLKNREGSSKTFKILKVGLGATFDETV